MMSRTEIASKPDSTARSRKALRMRSLASDISALMSGTGAPHPATFVSMTTAPPSGRPAAAALGAGALCWLLVGIVHPRARHGDLIGQIARLSPHLAAVHALAIASAAALLFGLAAFSLRRGIGRSPVLAALVVYALATVAVVAAGTIDGFVVAGVASVTDPALAAQRATTSALLSVCGVAIQAFTKVGFGGFAVAIALWSTDLARDRGALRAVGILGCAVAAATAVLLAVTPQIGPQALLGIGLLQALWYASLAALLAGDRV